MFGKKIILILTILLISTLLSAEETFSQEEQLRVNKTYNKTILAFMKDNKKIKRLVNRSYVYIAFPSIKKGGLILGYARGEGRAYNHGKWIGNVTMSQYTFGAQVGGQAYSEIIFFSTPQVFKDFTESGLITATQASVVGATASASGDVDIDTDIQVFTSDGAGLMLEATVGTQNFTYEAI